MRGTSIAVEFYFAYGSNMSRERLEARLGPVVHHGAARLAHYVHSFGHLGQDGTGKGTISPAAGEEVWGVLYQLSQEQTERLHPYETGYEIIQVEGVGGQNASPFAAYTYVSKTCTPDLDVISEYYTHYSQGMRENDFPASYIDKIAKQAKRDADGELSS